jgi:hypothetical protein
MRWRAKRTRNETNGSAIENEKDRAPRTGNRPARR